MAQQILHYDVIELLGEGAGSTIFLVRDPATGRNFALKRVVRRKEKDIRFIEQVETEFAVSKQFTHPNLRRSFELKINKTFLMRKTEAFLVMEYFDGKPLEVRPPNGLAETIDTFLLAAEGLRAMHALGYIHCDIKPNNILRDAHGGVKVIDFGQSIKVGETKDRIQGTPDYISPEQVERRPMTVQTDIYNLGATIYWSLTGKPIPTQYTVSRQGKYGFLMDTMIQSPQDLNPKVPLPLSNLVMDCIATNPKKRPVDMQSTIMRLELAKHVLNKDANLNKEANPVPASDAYEDSDVLDDLGDA